QKSAVNPHELNVRQEHADDIALVQGVVPLGSSSPRSQVELLQLPAEFRLEELSGLLDRKLVQRQLVPFSRFLPPLAQPFFPLFVDKTQVDWHRVTLLQVRSEGKEAVFERGHRHRTRRQRYGPID